MIDQVQMAETNGPAKRVALGVSGGIAAYKAVEVLRGLQRAGCEVRVGMTKRACEFVQPLTFRALSGSAVVVDDYAPENPDPIAHITFSQSVDLLVIAPATANIIAKFANGVADDFLTSTYLAATAPVLIAPAMNTTMWEHPATQRNLQSLRDDGVHIIEPDAGEMACGTIGPGRLSEPERIVLAALEILNGTRSSRDLANERILITAGATREEIDPVRFLSNRSSGRMGFAIAEAALKRGAQVTIIAGATSVEPPTGATVFRGTSAAEMRELVLRELNNATVFIAAAAVSDYRAAKREAEKIKKSDGPLSLELEPTPDILREAAAARSNSQLIIGFAAETEDIEANARKKLQSKRLDAIVANDVSRNDGGFESTQNAITIVSADKEKAVNFPLTSKFEAAERVLDEIVRLRSKLGSLSASKP